MGHEPITPDLSVDSKGGEGVWRRDINAADAVICYLPSVERIGIEHHQYAAAEEKLIITFARRKYKGRISPFIRDVSTRVFYVSGWELIEAIQIKRGIRDSFEEIHISKERQISLSKER